MANVEPLIKAWDEAIWEYSLVFEGLKDEDVWKRAHPRLLSIGELTAHVAYYEPRALTGPALIPEGDESIKSVLVDPAFKYYSANVEKPVVLKVGAEEAIAELKRVHEEAKAFATKVDRDTEDPIEGVDKMTWVSIYDIGFSMLPTTRVRPIRCGTCSDMRRRITRLFR
jgi:hypothetical protein